MSTQAVKHLNWYNLSLVAAIIVVNGGVWALAGMAFHGQPALLGIALVAWTLGLRHAMDADHIVAIDNVTRHLMQSGKRASTVGLFFSLGHSSVVVLVTLLLAVAAGQGQHWFDSVKDTGGLIGASVSSGVLFIVGLANAMTLARMLRRFRLLQRSDTPVEAEDAVLAGRPWGVARMLRPVFAVIARSWHMLPLGFLFGLGFDTATEISLLGLSAAQAAKGMTVMAVMIFPALFAVGMVLVDTLDTMLMVGAYASAFSNPLSKLKYNILVTSISVALALGVGGVEIVSLVSEHVQLSERMVGVLNSIEGLLDNAGYEITGGFLLIWGVSQLMARRSAYKNYI